jgi:hypothetical protein
MRLTWFPLVPARRPVLAGLVLAFLLGAASMSFAQDAAQQAAPAEKKAVAFTNDVGIVLIYVKEDKTADFEELLGKLKEGLAKTEVADLKQSAAGLKFLKAPKGPAPAGNVLYIMVADPVVKNAEYWILSNLYKLYPDPAVQKALFDKWTAAKGTVSPVPFDLTVAAKMQ